MEGLKEIKQVSESLNSIEKDLNYPIMKDFEPEIKDIESPETSSNSEILPQDELNKPLSKPEAEVETGLSDKIKQDIRDKTGWRDAVIDYIQTEEESKVYIDANLKEVNGNLERRDIDWNAKIPQDRIDRIRSLYGDEVAEKWASMTNLDLIKEGKAPYGPDGEQINLHHIGQKHDSPLAELTNTEHKQNDGILHDKIKDSEIDRSAFRTDRRQYWQARYESLTSN